MIPVNDAIVTALIAVALTALIVTWAGRGYWRAKVTGAYGDGHAAGIATQIGRQQRVERRRLLGLDEHLATGRWWTTALAGPEPATDVIVANVSTVTPHTAGPALPVVIPFPQGLPPGLREYAAGVLAEADAAAYRMLP